MFKKYLLQLWHLVIQTPITSSSSKIEMIDCETIQSVLNKTPWTFYAPEHFEIAKYEVRSRSVCAKNDDSWGKYFECNEKDYERFKAEPFQGGLQFEVRELYAKIDASVETPDYS